MWNITRLLCLCICAIGLSACTSYSPANDYSDYQYSTITSPLFLEGYHDDVYYSDQNQYKKEIVVPDSYHVGMHHSPSSHEDRDKEWVSNQNAQAYTIELIEGEQPADVANTLYKAPKKERMAEIKYQHAGKTYYKGLYGSYPSYEAAQTILNTLPQDIKQNANIKPWGSVQNNLLE